MEFKTFLIATLAVALILALTIDAKSVKGKKKSAHGKKAAHKKQDAPSDAGAGDAAAGDDAAAGADAGDDAAAKPTPAAGGDDAKPDATPAPAAGGAKPPPPGQPPKQPPPPGQPPPPPGQQPPAPGQQPPPPAGAANPAAGDEAGSGSGGGGMTFGVSPIVLGGHPHPGPTPEYNPMPSMPRQCEAPCSVECAPACMDWCCFPAIQPPPPVPAAAAPAPLPYGPLAYGGIPGLQQPQPPPIGMEQPDQQPQVSPQMPMPGYKKTKIGKQKSKTRKNKKDMKTSAI